MPGPACWMAAPDPTKSPAPMTPAMAIMERCRGLSDLDSCWSAGMSAPSFWLLRGVGATGGGGGFPGPFQCGGSQVSPTLDPLRLPRLCASAQARSVQIRTFSSCGHRRASKDACKSTLKSAGNPPPNLEPIQRLFGWQPELRRLYIPFYGWVSRWRREPAGPDLRGGNPAVQIGR